MLGVDILNVLFICTGNTCRSPMAEGILKTIAKEKGLNIVSKSAGIFANEGSPASENAVLTMGDIGIDIKTHRSRFASKELIDESDIILTMTKSHKDILVDNYPEKQYKIFLLNEYAFSRKKDIQDPFGGDIYMYEMARDEIIEAIKKIYDHI